MIYTLIAPLTTTSIILFWALTLIKTSSILLFLALLICLFISYWLIRKDLILNLKQLKAHFFSPSQLPQTAVILLFLITIGAILSPMAITLKVAGFDFIQFNGVGDYYKHLYTMVPIINDGLPPKHPYFPPETMSYYFGYYTIPSTLSAIFSIPPTITLFAYVLTTYFLALTVTTLIFKKYLKSVWAKTLALVLFLTGAGVDVIPFSAVTSGDITNTISNQAFLNGVGLQAVNLYTTLLYSPQHFLAAALTFVLAHHLLKEKPNLIFIALTSSYIILSSVFVSITLALWLLLAFIFLPLRQVLLKAGLISLILISPYLFFLTSRQNFFSFYEFTPYLFIQNLPLVFSFLVNTVITASLQYGPIIVTLLILFFVKRLYSQKQGLLIQRKALLIFCSLLIPFILTWFIKTPDFNDFSMRTLIPVQMSLPLLFLLLLERERSRLIRRLLFIILFSAILMGMFSLSVQYSQAWKDRRVINPETSQLLFKVRQLPREVKLAALEKDDWVYLIPPLGFKQVLTPHLWEASVSTTPKIGQQHSVYEQAAFKLFLDPTHAESAEEAVKLRNRYFNDFGNYFTSFKFDQLILRNQVWVKKGQNPYLHIFKEMRVKTIPLTPHFTLLDQPDLISKINSHQVVVENKPATFTPHQRQLNLTEGLYFLVSCGKDLFLEFEDYHEIFNQKGKLGCVGNLFYQPDNQPIKLSNRTTISEVIAYPVKIW